MLITAGISFVACLLVPFLCWRHPQLTVPPGALQPHLAMLNACWTLVFIAGTLLSRSQRAIFQAQLLFLSDFFAVAMNVWDLVVLVDIFYVVQDPFRPSRSRWRYYVYVALVSLIVAGPVLVSEISEIRSMDSSDAAQLKLPGLEAADAVDDATGRCHRLPRARQCVQPRRRRRRSRGNAAAGAAASAATLCQWEWAGARRWRCERPSRRSAHPPRAPRAPLDRPRHLVRVAPPRPPPRDRLRPLVRRPRPLRRCAALPPLDGSAAAAVGRRRPLRVLPARPCARPATSSCGRRSTSRRWCASGGRAPPRAPCASAALRAAKTSARISASK